MENCGASRSPQPIVRAAAHKGLADLDLHEWKAAEFGQRRSFAVHIAERNADIMSPELARDITRMREIADQFCAVEFDDQPSERRVIRQAPSHAIDEIMIAEHRTRKRDRDLDRQI